LPLREVVGARSTDTPEPAHIPNHEPVAVPPVREEEALHDPVGLDAERLQPPLPRTPARESVSARIADSVRELVNYMLFVDEAPLGGRVTGSSGFAERFSGEGPRDGKGRSLRQLDLERWLMRYPCSYMIYSAAFDALPDVARTAIYERMWQILSGEAQPDGSRRLSLADRRAIIEILQETKPGLPTYFQRPVR